MAKALSKLHECQYTANEVLQGPTTKVSTEALMRISQMPPSTFKNLFHVKGDARVVNSEAMVNLVLRNKQKTKEKGLIAPQ
jgi:hypothetical protein